MRPSLWDFEFTKIDLEDLDVTVQLSHEKALSSVTIAFRIDESALEGRAGDLKSRIEVIARNILLNAAASFEKVGELTASG